MTTPSPPRDQLVELAVTDFGIIDHVRLLLGPGMTALTGETGVIPPRGPPVCTSIYSGTADLQTY